MSNAPFHPALALGCNHHGIGAANDNAAGANSQHRICAAFLRRYDGFCKSRIYLGIK
jgi:hypothetical protein